MSAAPLRVLAVDHTGGVAPFRRKFEALASEPGIELTVLVPDRWVENFRAVRVDATSDPARGYRLRSGSVVWPGYENRGFFTTGLAGAYAAARPDILHLWEEPFSVFALQTLWMRRALAPRVKALFFSSDNLTRDGRYPYRPSSFYRSVERYAFRACAWGTAVSGEVEEVLRVKGYRGPVEIIPHGLDLADYPERTGADGIPPLLAREGLSRPVVGYVGRLLRQKGVETLLRAFAAVPAPRDGRSPALVLVGDGPDRDVFLRAAADLGLGDRVRFLPGVQHEAMPEIYRAIDVLVVPSRTTPRWKEQFGRVLIEGMAAGCAVIGSSSGAIPHVLQDAGLVFPEDDVPALTAAIRRALDEPGLAAALRSKGRERVRLEFTWKAIAAKLASVYRAMAANSEVA